ncbi:MAG: ribonuclease P protein component 1 [Haloquadratum sp.]|jgi:ribonuclease P protein subunit POP4|nr:ribonuclease P protein component 1 [Haloferacaceae archaeon]MDR9445912.1 ribonuclease P protein component 1 [Haloquadratum sp.]
MPVTPQTLVRHELIGLAVEVTGATDPTQVGTSGRLVDETQQTVTIATAAGDRQVPKAGTQLRFTLLTAGGADRRLRPMDEAAGDGNTPGITADRPATPVADRDAVTHVTVDGDRLLSRPADRIRDTGVPGWQ